MHVPKVLLSCEILRSFREGIQVLSLMSLKGTLGELHWVRKVPRPPSWAQSWSSTTIASEAKMGRAAASPAVVCTAPPSCKAGFDEMP